MCGNYARTTCHVSLIVIYGIMQYDARPKEANDESALLTTSSMQISGAYCHNYGQWEHEDSVNYALSIFQQLSLTDPSCV